MSCGCKKSHCHTKCHCKKCCKKKHYKKVCHYVPYYKTKCHGFRTHGRHHDSSSHASSMMYDSSMSSMFHGHHMHMDAHLGFDYD
jgi:hypothetical protein